MAKLPGWVVGCMFQVLSAGFQMINDVPTGPRVLPIRVIREDEEFFDENKMVERDSLFCCEKEAILGNSQMCREECFSWLWLVIAAL